MAGTRNSNGAGLSSSHAAMDPGGRSNRNPQYAQVWIRSEHFHSNTRENITL